MFLFLIIMTVLMNVLALFFLVVAVVASFDLFSLLLRHRLVFFPSLLHIRYFIPCAHLLMCNAFFMFIHRPTSILNESRAYVLRQLPTPFYFFYIYFTSFGFVEIIIFFRFGYLLLLAWHACTCLVRVQRVRIITGEICKRSWSRTDAHHQKPLITYAN